MVKIIHTLFNLTFKESIEIRETVDTLLSINTIMDFKNFMIGEHLTSKGTKC